MCRQRLARAGREQLSQRTGRRSLLVAALLALLNHGAVFTALPACSPPRHLNVSDTAPGFECPLSPSGAMCSWLGSWLPARLGVLGRAALAARSPFLTARGGGTWGATHGSGISCAETMSGRFAQRRGEASV